MEESIPVVVMRVKIFITGAKGFLGSALTPVCERNGFEVHTFEKDIFELTPKDLEGVDYLFHLAAKTNIVSTINDPIKTTKVNVLGTVHVLECAAAAKVKKVVFPSTASVYGRNAPPFREDMQTDPIEQYSFQKVSGEQAMKAWSARRGVSTVSLRLFQVFGEHYRADSVLASFVSSKKKEEPLPVTYEEVGGEKVYASRDFVHVEDVADAFIKAAVSKETGKGEIINVASGRATSLRDVAHTLGGDIIDIPLRPYEVLTHEADISCARELLQWEPRIGVLDWLSSSDTRAKLMTQYGYGR